MLCPRDRDPVHVTRKYQVLWRVDGFDFACQEQTLKLLAIAFGGDPACTDCNRVLRIPGFLNHKYNPSHRVAVDYLCDPSGPRRLPARCCGGRCRALRPCHSATEAARKAQHSESDWAWVSHELAHGKDAVKLTRELASRRSDKPNPLYYAQRTVDMASARLWLIEGIRIDDVITMLESRRRFELPAALCSARAWEIATTAQRMIARRKIA